MKSREFSAWALVIASLVVALGVSDSAAQTVCTGLPYLGASGPELCVNVSEDSGASLDLRGPSPITINQTIGDYRVNVAISYVAEAAGMGVTIEGTVRRTSAGTGGITIRADGGTNVSVPASSGSLVLIGDATGPSHVQLGGAAGFRHASGDVVFESYLVTCDELIVGGGSFECTIDNIPVNPGAVATTNITGFHITNVGDIIDIPSTTTTGLINTLPTTRRFNDIAQLIPGVLPLENRVAAIEPGPNPDLVLLNLWNSGVNMNHLDACRLPPPYDGTGMSCQTDIDFGPIFGVHAICVTAPNEAYAAYTKWVGSNYDTRVVRYDGLTWVVETVVPTSSQDFHTATCFQTTHGLHLKTFNNTADSVVIFRRNAPGSWQTFASFDSTYFSGTPGSPFFGAPIGKAASFGSFGMNLQDSAAITVGLTNGTLEFGRLTTTTPPTLVTHNLGPADGESAVDCRYSVRRGFCYDVAWQDQGTLRGGVGLFYGPLSQIESFTLGTIDPGTLIPDWQGVASGIGPDGRHYFAADKFYELRISDTGGPPTVTELWDYPYRTLGGPVDILFPDRMKVGFVPGPGSQMLGILSIVEIFSDGFETGDPNVWSNVVP